MVKRARSETDVILPVSQHKAVNDKGPVQFRFTSYTFSILQQHPSRGKCELNSFAYRMNMRLHLWIYACFLTPIKSFLNLHPLSLSLSLSLRLSQSIYFSVSFTCLFLFHLTITVSISVCNLLVHVFRQPPCVCYFQTLFGILGAVVLQSCPVERQTLRLVSRCQ